MSRKGLVGKGQFESRLRVRWGGQEVTEGLRDTWASPGVLRSPQELQNQFLVSEFWGSWGGLGVSVVLD